MAQVGKTATIGIRRKLGLSLAGMMFVAPVALLSGNPDITPDWVKGTVAGVPLLSLLIVGFMAALASLALIALNNIENKVG